MWPGNVPLMSHHESAVHCSCSYCNYYKPVYQAQVLHLFSMRLRRAEISDSEYSVF